METLYLRISFAYRRHPRRQRGRRAEVREEGRVGHEVGHGQPRPVRHDGEDEDVRVQEHGARGTHPVIGLYLQLQGSGDQGSVVG